MLIKPTHVKKKVWEQHVNWMNVMREGSLNDKDIHAEPRQAENNATRNDESVENEISSARTRGKE